MSFFGSNMRNEGQEGGSFVDCGEDGTGEDITGAYWKCGACDGILREGDTRCPSCFETIDGGPLVAVEGGCGPGGCG